MLKLTLDTNCIIALDENREPDASCLRALLAFHDAGEAQLQLVATSASERQRSGPYLTNFSQFQDRLANLGLGHLDLLCPLMVLDVCYLDWAVLGSKADVALLHRIHDTLFPTQPFELHEALGAVGPEADPKAIEHKWRNRHLDVHGLWCHIHYGGDAFVTTDRNFPKKQDQLDQLGAPLVLSPCEAEAQIRNAINPN